MGFHGFLAILDLLQHFCRSRGPLPMSGWPLAYRASSWMHGMRAPAPMMRATVCPSPALAPWILAAQLASRGLEQVGDLCLPKLDGTVMQQLGQTLSKQLDALASSRAASDAMASVQDAPWNEAW